MYHPSRGGVRGGRDQFNWDDVKADKHRENYIGHSIKAPVGRWQKGKDLHWYARDKKGDCLTAEAKKEEIQRVKEEEEQAMRELLGLAPKCENRPYGTRLDKREAAELLKKGTSAEDLAPGYAEGERVQGLGFARAPHHSVNGNFLPKKVNDASHEPQAERVNESLVGFQRNEATRQSDGHGSDCPGEDAGDRKIRRKEEKKRRREERKRTKQEKSRHESDSKKNQKKKRRHDSDSSDRMKGQAY